MLSFLNEISPFVVWSVLGLLAAGAGTWLAVLLIKGRPQPELRRTEPENTFQRQERVEADSGKATDKIFCLGCGARNPGIAHFCSVCGAVFFEGTPRLDSGSGNTGCTNW